MTQPSLFHDGYTPVRRTDPPQSRQAADEIAPKLPLTQDRMLRAFRLGSETGGGMTANEAAKFCHSMYGGNHETFRKRAKELRDAMRIKQIACRHCAVTGKLAASYITISDGLPKELAGTDARARRAGE